MNAKLSIVSSRTYAAIKDSECDEVYAVTAEHGSWP